MNRRVLGAALLVAFGLLSPAVHASADQVDDRAPLVGHVVDRHGAGVSGVCVSASPFHGDADSDTATSGRGGRFVLNTTSPEGSETAYIVLLRPCATKRNVAPEYYSHNNGYEGSSFVVVRAGHLTHKNFVLRTGGVVQGVVTTAQGRPFAQACVSTSQWGDDAGTGTSDTSWAITDAAGRYRIQQLAPGPHRLLVSRCSTPSVPLAASGGPEYLAQQGQPIPVGEGQTREVDMAVAPGV